MFFDIAIATGQEPAAIQRVMNALERSAYQNYAITLWSEDDDHCEIRRLFGDDWRVQSLVIGPAGEGIFARWNAAIRQTRADALVCLTDDLELYPDCLTALRETFESEGNDILAPLHITRAGMAKSPCLAPLALGVGFRDRFPQGQCFCPDYRWFHGDSELVDYACRAGRLRSCEGARAARFLSPLRAVDPGFAGESRRRYRRDGRIRQERRRRDRLWGRDEDLTRAGQGATAGSWKEKQSFI